MSVCAQKFVCMRAVCVFVFVVCCVLLASFRTEHASGLLVVALLTRPLPRYSLAHITMEAFVNILGGLLFAVPLYVCVCVWMRPWVRM